MLENKMDIETSEDVQSINNLEVLENIADGKNKQKKQEPLVKQVSTTAVLLVDGEEADDDTEIEVLSEAEKEPYSDTQFRNRRKKSKKRVLSACALRDSSTADPRCNSSGTITDEVDEDESKKNGNKKRKALKKVSNRRLAFTTDNTDVDSDLNYEYTQTMEFPALPTSGDEDTADAARYRLGIGGFRPRSMTLDSNDDSNNENSPPKSIDKGNRFKKKLSKRKASSKIGEDADTESENEQESTTKRRKRMVSPKNQKFLGDTDNVLKNLQNLSLCK